MHDDGAAYRFVIDRPNASQVTNESAEFCFADDYPAFIPYVNDNRGGERYCYSFESYYDGVKDTSWIKPGKVAWDWWNNTNISGVDFQSGMNTDTYLYYIDFAAKNKIEYIIIDEGWSGKESLMEDLNPEIDLKRLIAYGQQKGVGIILWSSWHNLIGSNPLGDVSETDYKHTQQTVSSSDRLKIHLSGGGWTAIIR